MSNAHNHGISDDLLITPDPARIVHYRYSQTPSTSIRKKLLRQRS